MLHFRFEPPRALLMRFIGEAGSQSHETGDTESSGRHLKVKIDFINGLRGIAIMGVVFHHCFFSSFKYGEGYPLHIADIVASSGWLGVNLFFFLSGFVLYLPYVQGHRSFNAKMDILDFYKRRFLRLYPLYILIAFIALVFFYNGRDAKSWVLKFFFVTFPFKESTFSPSPNWVLWSIGVEFWFSIAFPWIAICIKRFHFSKIFLICIPASLSIRLIGELYFSTREMGNILNFVSDSVFGRFDDFLFGMYAAKNFVAVKVRDRPQYLTAAISSLCIITTLYLWAFWWRKDIPLWSAAFFSLFINVGLLLFITRVVQSFSAARWLLSFSALQMLGLMCYSIYLWHMIILNRIGLSYYYPLVVLFLSALTYRYVEFGAERNWKKLLPARK